MDDLTPHERAAAESFRRCPPTCPAVDAALEAAVSRILWVLYAPIIVPNAEALIHEALTVQLTGEIKLATTKLRSALVEACTDLEAFRSRGNR